MFQIQDVLFFLQCRALTRDIRYTLPPSTYHAPLQGGRKGRRQARQQYLTYLTLLELGGSSSNYICTSDGTRKGTKKKKFVRLDALLAALGSRVLYAGRPRRQPRHCITSLPTSLARLPRPPACLPACRRYVDTMDVYVSRGEAQCIPPLRRYWGPEKRGTVRHLFY